MGASKKRRFLVKTTEQSRYEQVATDIAIYRHRGRYFKKKITRFRASLL